MATISTQSISQPGSDKTVYFVDPLGGDPVDNKDLFVYVNLKAIKNNRSILITDSSNSQEGSPSTQFQNKTEREFDINFIGYRKDAEGNHIMTTDWTNKFSDPVNSDTILGSITNLSNDVYEGFGIQNIEIEVKAQAPPLVTIKFVDVRGGGLFDNETGAAEYNEAAPYELDKSNPYSIFFMLPRPLFKLTVKGYYGNPVNFCLYMTSWDGTFNSETGNFEITAKFIGYSFAFLQDIKIGHLLGVANTVEGRGILTEVSLENSIKYNTTFPPLSIDDLMFKFNRITVDREADQKNSTEFDKLRVINEQIKYLSEFKSYLGYASYPNIVNTNVGAYFGRNILNPDNDQIFFRDVGIINKNAVDKYTQLKTIISDGIRRYNEFQKGTEKLFQTNASISEADLILPKMENTNNPNCDKTNYRLTLESALSTVNSTIKNHETKNYDIIPKATISDFSGRTHGHWPLDDQNFFIIDMYLIRRNIEDKLNLLATAKSNQEEIIKKQLNEKINSVLGFTPTIKNIMGILCNNVEAFLKLIRKTAIEAHTYENSRYGIISGYETDVPITVTKLYPFPQVIDKNTGQEKYLETIPEVFGNQSQFPEIKLVQNMADGLVAAYKQLQYFNQINNSIPLVKNSNYFPIYPGDVINNPYQSMDGLPMDTIDNSFSTTFLSPIIERPFQISLFSNFNGKDGKALSLMSELEAINFNDSLVTKTYTHAFNQLKEDQNSSDSLLQLALKKNIISESNGKYSYYLPFNNETVFSINQEGDSESNIRVWNDSLKLRDDIVNFLSTKSGWETILKSKNQNSDYLVNYFDNINTYSNKCYFSLESFKLENVKTSILSYFKGTASSPNEELLKTGKVLKNYNISQLELINTSNDPYFYTPKSVFNNSLPFTQSSLYTANASIPSISAYTKGYLILSSLMFGSDDKLIKQIENDVTKIIRLPRYYLLWLGAAGYRKSTEILPFNSEYPSVPQDKFYYITTKEQSSESIQQSSIDYFTDQFTTWINSDEFNIVCSNFEKLFNTPNLNSDEKKSIYDILNPYLFKEVDLIIHDPKKYVTGNSSVTIDKEVLIKYLQSFMSKYHNVYKDVDKIVVEEKALNNLLPVVNDMDIKGAYYNDLKHIYDTWIAGSKDDKIYASCPSNIAGTNDKVKLIDYFLFVDKFRSQIAGDTIININSFNDLASQRDRGLFGFISKLLTDSYFMHYSLPVYVNFNDEEEVKKIFEPQDTLKNVNSGPLMLCVYNGPPSTVLKGNTQYKDDSFRFDNKDDISNIFKSSNGDKKSYLVAFNVNYGSKNQSIFKNIALTTAENRMTGEYITLLSNFIGTGQSKPAYKDNSIFSLMRSRSYTSSIEMMGNMLIQPQMYYQLNNIPFFGGSYMIMSVSHSIKPNHISTSFKGVRQTRHNVKIIKEATSYLNFQFNEGFTSAFTFTDITTIQSPQLKEQLSDPRPVLDKSFMKKYAPSGLSILRAFNSSSDNNIHVGLDIEVDGAISVVNASGIIINPSDNDKVVIRHNLETDGYYYYTGYFNINKVAPHIEIIPKQLIGTSKSTDLQSINPRPIYYHFEIRRSKSKVDNYDEYSKLLILDPQPFTQLPTKQEKLALHSYNFTN